MDAITKDKRFAQIARDPRFHRMKRKDRKVTIDKRFQGMFNDKRFKVKYTVDKRGRPVRTTTNENLQKYYDLSEEDSNEASTEDEEEEEQEREEVEKKLKKKQKTSEEDESDEESVKLKCDKTKRKSESSPLKKVTKKNNRVSQSEDEEEKEEEEEVVSEDDEDEEEEEDEEGVDLARGVGNMETSSSSEEDSDDEDSDVSEDLARGEGNQETSSDDTDSDESEEEEDFDHKWGELHYTAPAAKEVTSRLAVCNMDWDRIKAQDVFVLLNSFKPAGGVIKSVSVYPSEFGKQRMAEEDVKGPKELVEKGPCDDEMEEEGSELQREKMRQYQLNRLRYYYAVVECDCPDTANTIYEQCDGIEYESSATRVDLRFIPNDMEFDDKPKSVATSLPSNATYKPSQFTTTALQQSKVDLTWDETDKDRTAITMRKFTKEDLEDLDMKDYLASSESEADEDPYANFLEQPDFVQGVKEESDEVVLQQYNELIKMAKSKDKKKKKKKEDDVGMEISWDPGLMDDAEKKILKKSSGTETPWEKYLVKKQEKKRKDRKKKKSDKREDAQQDTDEQQNKDVATEEPDVPIEGVESTEEGDGQAFSDDDLPSDVDMDDDFFKGEIDEQPKGTLVEKKKKKGKGKKKEVDEEEKKKQAELALLMDEDDNRQHFNLKDIMETEGSNLSKTKRKKLKKLKKKQEAEGTKTLEDTFTVDVKDSRFDDLYKNALYNIDPSAPEFKATKSTDALIQEKLRRRRQQSSGGATSKAQKRPLMGDSDATVVDSSKQARHDATGADAGVGQKDLALASLVKSVKAKTQTLKQKKRR